MFERLDKKSEVPVGLLANLGKAKARNCYLDLTCSFRFHRLLGRNFSDETAGCWRRPMGKSALGNRVQVMEASGWRSQKTHLLDGRRLIGRVLAEAVY